MFSFSLLGDDAIFRGTGANIYPIEETDIILESEIILFYQNTENSFEVNANLIFYNPEKENKKVKLGFPDIGIEEGENLSEIKPALRNFQIFVNGKEVKKINLLKIGKNEDFYWNFVSLFNVNFKAKSYTSITHIYNLESTLYSNGSQCISYLFETGKFWDGKIKKATFIYKFLYTPVGLNVYYGDKVIVGYRIDERPIHKPLNRKKTGINYSFKYFAYPFPSLQITFENIEPQKNIELCYFTWDGIIPFLEKIPLSNSKILSQTIEESSFLLYGFLMKLFKSKIMWEPLDRDELYLQIDSLLNYYDSKILEALILASYGAELRSPYKEIFYDSGLFMPSSFPLPLDSIKGIGKELINYLKEKRK